MTATLAPAPRVPAHPQWPARPGQADDAHPLIAGLDQIEAVIAAMAGSVQAWDGLDPATVRVQCARLRKAKAAMDGHLTCATGVLESAGTARRNGATSTGALLGRDFGGDRRSGDQVVRTGKRIETAKADATRDALVRGQITRTQADVIAAGLGRLSPQVGPTDRAVCERDLLKKACELSLGDLRRAADRAAEPVLPPATVDRDEASNVQAREREAWARTELVMTDQHDGTTSGRFLIPTVQAMMLTTLIQAHSAPRRHHLHPGPGRSAADPVGDHVADQVAGHVGGHGAGRGAIQSDPSQIDPSQAAADALDESENLTYAQRAGRALCAILEHVPTTGYATSGDTPATLLVTLDLDTLTAGVGEKVAALPGAVTMSPSQARRLACQHGIIPAVLGGSSIPLDLGYANRLFSPGLRVALALRDQGCAFPGCDRPPGWCEAHHILPVGRGGATDLANGVLLCARHHHTVHDQDWTIRLHPQTGHPLFKAPWHSGWRASGRYRPRHRTDPAVNPADRITATAPPDRLFQ